MGGLLGGTLSGVLSDKSIKAAQGNPKAGLVGRRVQICMAYTAACIGVLFTLKGVPAGKGGSETGPLRLSAPVLIQAVSHCPRHDLATAQATRYAGIIIANQHTLHLRCIHRNDSTTLPAS